MNTTTARVPLSDREIEALGAELDAMRAEVMGSLGERDRRYILRLIGLQRALALSSRVAMLAAVALHPWWGHALAGWRPFLAVLGIGAIGLGLAKILENMEIGHNVLHAQWDWMHDPTIRSDAWEWDSACPADQWRHSHNVVHHTWTNVLGKDRDVGYGMLRVTREQRWHPFYLVQPLSTVAMALFFEWFIAFHDVELNHVLDGRKTWADARPLLARIGWKARRQVMKDYVLWPALAGPFFPWVLAANAVANVIRNVWSFAIIFCGHFPSGVHHFAKSEVAGETRARWYVRQIMGSCNIEGGRLFHVLSGNLSHQIEHHLFPDMPSNRYPEIAPRVRALAARYALPYNSARLGRQLGSTMAAILRLSLPGPTPAARELQPA
ncbi:MAG TPA: acyl-CoA desaturase [Candidatus Binatia bacterium]|nr:acyl-CoA desaturase [Candidatus Binatia bacterium]